MAGGMGTRPRSTVGDPMTLGNMRGRLADRRGRAAGACWVIPAIDCIVRPIIAPGARLGAAIRPAGYSCNTRRDVL
jgi:hypothetical protein